MEFFRIKRDIPFMKHALTFNVISLLTFVLAVVFLATKGLHFGIDFTGGTVLEVHYSQDADISKIRQTLEKLHFSETPVQYFGSNRDVLIRLPLQAETSNAQVANRVFQELCGTNQLAEDKRSCGQDAAKIELKRVEFVGPQVGQELAHDGALALLLVSLGIVIYLAFRFEWRFALSAIIANLHDVVIILGFFAFFQWEFSLPVLAAILAVLGYSVNESVVIADRIRENFKKMRKASVTEVIDNAITSTISRTVITHGSTQLMVTSMLIFGGETLHYFAMALTIGILFGIYSSVLVMAPLVRWLGVSREDLIKPEKKPDAPSAVV